MVEVIDNAPGFRLVNCGGSTRVRAVVPMDIEAGMSRWRCGDGPLPTTYIDFHENLARRDLDSKRERGLWQVHATYLLPDGWGDGMKFVVAIIETRNGELHKVKWADSQSWFRDTGHGWALYTDNDFTENEGSSP